jgi:hypothetical protein
MNLYISHKNYNWTEFKSKYSLVFLNGKNINSINWQIDYCTSLEDLGLKTDQWNVVLDLADRIILIDLDISFSNKIADSELFQYMNFFNFLKKYHYAKTENFRWIEQFPLLFESITDTHKTDKNPLWITGCSITVGQGVDANQRFADILATKLDLDPIILAKSGSSITWQADQILRSDIKKNDLVVWGLTNFARVDYAEGFDWQSQAASNLEFKNFIWKYWTYEYFDSYTRSMECIKSIQHVNNFCKKIKAKLILVNLLDNVWSNLVFSKLSNYLDLTVPQKENNKFNYIDFGWDNDHPGPKQHQLYADNIYQFIKEKNYHG